MSRAPKPSPIWFLFLTDLHIKAEDTSAQRNTLRELLDDIRRTTAGKTIDFIVIAGDLAYSGQKAEYDLVKGLVITPIREMLGERIPVFAAPGNHDLDCSEVDPIQWENIGKRRREHFFSEDAEGRRVRRSRSAGFKNWEKFLDSSSLVSVRPSIEVTRRDSLVLEGRGHVEIYSTNTALFSDKEPDTQHHEVPAPTPSIRNALLSHDAHESAHKFIIGHHPIDTFEHVHKQRLKRLLSEHRAVYLHGHTHVTQASFGPDGLLSLGLSAGYMKSADADPEPVYRNGFALVALDDALHVLPRQWSNESGAWERASGLPVEFSTSSSVLPDGYVLSVRQGKGRQEDSVADAQSGDRISPRITTIRTLNNFTPQNLFEVVGRRRLLADLPVGTEAKKIESSPDALVVEVGDAEERQRFRYISATGHILSQEAVERINNEIDYEDLAAYTVISVGYLASEAKTSYLRLSRRKPIKIVAQNDLADLLQQSLHHAAIRELSQFDAATTEGEFLLSEEQVHVLLHDRRQTSWFVVMNSSGSYLGADEDIVRSLRSFLPRLAFSAYNPPEHHVEHQSMLQPPVFNAEEYLRKCYAEYNSVRYAALATFGLRLSNTSLEDLYISASADYEQSSMSETGLRRALEEALQGLGIKDPVVRAQMEAQINRRLRGHGTVESGVARRLYQRFGTVIVLGDPGSGKTLFAKHEMLAYCESGEEASSWYRLHVPVYVPLAEMARSHNWDEDLDIMRSVSMMCDRQGLGFPIQHLLEHDGNGRLALFFDGLDEIVSLDQRITVFEKICDYALRAKAKGNRVIVTSRPAAVRMLNIPETFHLITLRGLSVSEMRELARRILSAKVSESGVDLPLEPTVESSDDSLVETLLADCQRVPGIGRIARNPLLFTLLTMIYANHGPLAAKRHRVYQQAVQTLTSARARSVGQRVFSESDLRRRLGAVALSAYQSPQTVVPSWKHVHNTIQHAMEEERGESVGEGAVEAFIQQVAESTGLLVLHPTPDDDDGGNITFMHQSFMEYYAAVGVSEMSDYIEFVSQRSASPRWREIIVLLAGIIGDRTDVTPLIISIISAGGDTEKYTLEGLLFAFECALETDVPPERSQHVLTGAVEEAFSGVLLYDDQLRRDVGLRLAELHQSAAPELVEDLMSAGLRSEAAHVAAAYIDVFGYLSRQVEVGDGVIGDFSASAGMHKDTSVLISALNAMSESEQLRAGPHVEKLLKAGFQGSTMAQYAAVNAVEKSPGLANLVWRELMEMIRGDKEYLAVRAANAVIRAGWRVAIVEDVRAAGELAQQRADLQVALSVLARSGDDHAIIGSGDSVPRTKVESLLSSSDEEAFLLGVHLLPWVARSEQFIHDRLMIIVRSDGRHRVVAAALDSIRMSYDAQSLIEMRDLDAVRRSLREGHRDVRMAACRLLGQFLSDEVVAKDVISYGSARSSSVEEYCGAVAQLGRVPHDTDAHEMVIDFFNGQIDSLLGRGDYNSERPMRSFQALLEGSSMVEAPLLPRNVRRLQKLHGDFRVDSRLRRSVVAYLGDIVPMTEQSARFLIDRTGRVPADLLGEHFGSVQRFLVRCSRKVATIRAVRLELGRMQEVVLERLDAVLRQSKLGHQSPMVTSGRKALRAIARMESIYSEVAAQPVASAR